MSATDCSLCKGGRTLALEIISELDTKIDSLIESLHGVREENQRLKNELSQKDQRIEELEKQNNDNESAMDSLRGDTEDRQKKLDAAAERLRSIVTKLESVE